VATYTEILKRRFQGQWSITDEDYNSIIWYSKTKKPTQAELDELSDKVDFEIEAEIKAKADKKNAAQAKLAALGLTADDLKALGL
jgi:hypothetical protein